MPFSKIADNRTLIINKAAKIIPFGINIDVFPIDDVPIDDQQWRRFRKKQIKMIRLNLQHILNLNDVHGIKNKLSVLYAKIYCGLLYPNVLNHINEYICKNNDHGYDYCFECVQGLHVKRPFPKELFNDITEWKFEDRLYLGFRNADNYLRNTYGNYMELPPKELQLSHHQDVAFWIDK